MAAEPWGRSAAEGASRVTRTTELAGPGRSVVRRTSGRLNDGRSILYYDDARTAPAREVVDARFLPPQRGTSEIRYDSLLDSSVIIAAQRQTRSYHPSTEDCPLCPSRPGHLTEIPASDYDVVVIENRFPALSNSDLVVDSHVDDGLLGRRPGVGSCEVVCFTSDHDASFVDLSAERVGTVLTAWTDRSDALSTLPEVVQVFCFENRGREIGVTLEHPHGQIYAYPFVSPRTKRMLASVAAHRVRTGRNLFDDVVGAEREAQVRVIAYNEDWVAFVPHAARWPYEVHLYPTRRVPDMTVLDDSQRATFAPIYLDVLARFDRLFDARTPYISAWHQAPAVAGRDDFALHLELFSSRRAPDRLKYPAGSESGMDVFANDIAPEAAAAHLRRVSGTDELG